MHQTLPFLLVNLDQRGPFTLDGLAENGLQFIDCGCLVRSSPECLRNRDEIWSVNVYPYRLN
ncbi:hypothetical protein D3C81_2250180 [compost metagenome]